MSKYDKMIEFNRRNSELKISLAKQCMWKMVEEGEKVTIAKLERKTGLSKGFFYKNPQVRKELDRVQEQQIGMPDPRRMVLDLAMSRELDKLKRQIRELERENTDLKQQIHKLKNAVQKKNLKTIMEL